MANTDNPFAALLGDTKSGIDKALIEEIFLFTLKKDQSFLSKKRALLCLADVVVSDESPDTQMAEELLEHAVFERLMLDNTKEYLIAGPNEDDALEIDTIKYLNRGFTVCEQISLSSVEHKSSCDKIKSLIVTNASTCMRQPDLYPGRTIWEQWKILMEKYDDDESLHIMEFLVHCVQKIYIDEEPLEALGALKANFYPLLGKIQTDISQANLITLKKNVFSLLSFFVRDRRVPQLGEVLIDYLMPNPNTNGNFLLFLTCSLTFKYIIYNY